MKISVCNLEHEGNLLEYTTKRQRNAKQARKIRKSLEVQIGVPVSKNKQ